MKAGVAPGVASGVVPAATGKELKAPPRRLANQPPELLAATGKELKVVERGGELQWGVAAGSNWERIERQLQHAVRVAGDVHAATGKELKVSKSGEGSGILITMAATGKELKGAAPRSPRAPRRPSGSNWERIERLLTGGRPRHHRAGAATGKELKVCGAELERRSLRLQQQLGKN